MTMGNPQEEELISLSNQYHNRSEWLNQTNETIIYGLPPVRDSLGVVIPITIIYFVIFVTGVIGNISTCIVIAKNKSMHTTVNYYLFSLAMSDFILLISGVPNEVYSIWFKYPYIFGENYCILRGIAAETSANATVLTITAFTIERYVAICHPFLSHTMSKLSRAVKHIIVIWIVSLLLAIPLAIQFEVTVNVHGFEECTVHTEIIKHSFELSTILVFFIPMTLITVLYLLIGLKLRSRTVRRENGGGNSRTLNSSFRQQTAQGTKRVLKMLVAVVVAFGLCWFPFHAQRLIFMYFTKNVDLNDYDKVALLTKVFTVVTYVSGILYYLSTCINPLLYNIMSHKFRKAFKETMATYFFPSEQQESEERSYRVFSRNKRRCNGYQESSEYSGNSTKEDSLHSSTTQKPAGDSIALPRNASLKAHHNSKSNQVTVCSSSNTRDLDESLIVSYPYNTKTGAIYGSNINISTNPSYSEVHLNIFTGSEHKKFSKNELYINVHPKHFDNDEMSFKFSIEKSNSTLNISIGNNSKAIRKRSKSKVRFRIFQRISYIFSQRKRIDESFCSPELCIKERYNLGNGCVNLSHDDLHVTINNSKTTCLDFSQSNTLTNHVPGCPQKDVLSERERLFKELHVFTENNYTDELDEYMNEIKSRVS